MILWLNGLGSYFDVNLVFFSLQNPLFKSSKLIAAVPPPHTHSLINRPTALACLCFFSSLFTLQIVSLISLVWLDLDGFAYKTLAYVSTCTAFLRKCVGIFRWHKTLDTPLYFGFWGVAIFAQSSWCKDKSPSLTLLFVFICISSCQIV